MGVAGKGEPHESCAFAIRDARSRPQLVGVGTSGLRGHPLRVSGSLLAWGLILAVLIVLFGAYALLDGVLAVIAAFRSSGRGMRRPLLLIEGAIGILFGILALFLPGLTALALLYIIAFWVILSGIARIVMAIMLRREIENEWSIALSGVLSVILGIVLILLPGAGLLAYTWLIGLLALALGFALVYYAFSVRGQRMSGSRVT